MSERTRGHKVMVIKPIRATFREFSDGSKIYSDIDPMSRGCSSGFALPVKFVSDAIEIFQRLRRELPEDIGVRIIGKIKRLNAGSGPIPYKSRNGYRWFRIIADGYDPDLHPKIAPHVRRIGENIANAITQKGGGVEFRASKRE